MTTAAVALRVLGGATVALLAAVLFSPLPEALDAILRTPARLEPADAIVVLGAGLNPDGSLNGSSQRRAVHGMVLFQRHLAPVLVFVGPAYDTAATEAEVRARLALTLGLPAGAIVTVPTPRTTREEAAQVGVLLRARGTRTVLLVSDRHHMTRAVALFAREGFRVLAAPSDEGVDRGGRPEDRLRLAHRVGREAVARLYYRLAGYL
ncbi:MAG: YdcF family protein [Candidatus Rokubacteria bacterium]|nr:YdcF family protein [Candidatus Rokubacteria bacterium]